EETAEQITQAGGRGIPIQVDHLEPDRVEELVARIERAQGRLDLLVNDIWAGEFLVEWNKPVWEHSLERGEDGRHPSGLGAGAGVAAPWRGGGCADARVGAVGDHARSFWGDRGELP